jgi:hypothetical protein
MDRDVAAKEPWREYTWDSDIDCSAQARLVS